PQLPELINRILIEAQISPNSLELELTEGVAIQDPKAATLTMDALRNRGIWLSIDDFGTGYSSLSQLKRFQIYKLKIDQSFIRDVDQDINDRAIVSAIIRMAQALGMQTTAEGVEREEQLDFLRAQGCDEAQGYWFSKPVPPAQISELLRTYCPWKSKTASLV
ncbi:MAG: EAL domain-containing protein, partial [Comamonas sp.]